MGFDVFGPWTVQTRKTRGGAANTKQWGLVFTCLSSTAIHIEVLEAMDASSFICTLRRFFALRGHAKLLRCDRGTNFVRSNTELQEAESEFTDADGSSTFPKHHISAVYGKDKLAPSDVYWMLCLPNWARPNSRMNYWSC